MAKLSTTYTYTTAGGTIIFNNGDLGDGTDKFWISRIFGLDGPIVRSPIDPVPFGDGDLLHTFRRGGRRPRIEAILLVESSPIGTTGCEAALDEMECDLKTAANSNVTSSATLAWTDACGSHSLTVFHVSEPELTFEPSDQYATRTFTLALASASANL